MPTSDSNSDRGLKIFLPMCSPSNSRSWRDERSSRASQNTTVEHKSRTCEGGVLAIAVPETKPLVSMTTLFTVFLSNSFYCMFDGVFYLLRIKFFGVGSHLIHERKAFFPFLFCKALSWVLSFRSFLSFLIILIGKRHFD